ncbi:MAG TPA: hypothetical protein VKQ32_11400 [Polyangia bacterium]|nr:hypothetical protein [Polyangia bacterium]
MMRLASIAIVFGLLIANACGSTLGGENDGGGGMGRGGTTGDAATTGVGGRGGAIGGTGGGSCAGQDGGAGCIACSPGDLTVPVETCLLAADGTPVLMSMNVAVTAVSFDQVPGPNCDSVSYTGSTANSGRIVVQDSSGQRWSIFVRVPNLPANLVQAGDVLDLKLTGGHNGLFSSAATQTIVLNRGGQLLMFGYVGGVLEATTTDVLVQADGVACGPGTGVCTFVPQRARVAVSALEDTILPGRTGVIGDMAITVDQFHSFSPGGGGCDGADRARLAGYSISGVGP